jgi:uncharacterized membrane protein YhaH (DUF805 family)
MPSSSEFGRRGQAPTTSQAAASGQAREGRQPAAPAGADSSRLYWLLTSYQGRCRRIHYWLGRFGLLIVYVAALIIIHVAFPGFGRPAGAHVGPLLLNLVLTLVNMALGIGFLWAIFAIDVKRCHDRDRTGWFSLLSLVPLLSLWPLVELGFLDGKRGENRFGPSPKGVDTAVFD